MTQFSHLPNEMKVEIFSHLDIPDLLEMSTVSRQWLALCRDDFVWKRVAKAVEFPLRASSETPYMTRVRKNIKKLYADLGAFKIPPPLSLDPNRKISDIKRLIRWKTAWNTLIVWQKLCRDHQLGFPLLSHFSTLERAEWTAASFIFWCTIERRNINRIQNLFIYNLGISQLPSEIGQCKNLTYLNLKGNRLTNLPDSLCDLENLCQLDATHNKIKKLPNGMERLTALVTLNLQNNRLKSLHDGVGRIRNLCKLNLEDNRLKDLPESFSEMQWLEVLNLSGNHLSSIPGFLGITLKFDWLFLSRNPVAEQPEKILEFEKRLGLPFLKVQDKGNLLFRKVRTLK